MKEKKKEEKKQYTKMWKLKEQYIWSEKSWIKK